MVPVRSRSGPNNGLGKIGYIPTEFCASSKEASHIDCPMYVISLVAFRRKIRKLVKQTFEL